VVVLPTPSEGWRRRGILWRPISWATPPKVWTELKNGRSAKDGAPERLRCGTVQNEVS